MDINNYLDKNKYILDVLIDYCKDINEYKKEIAREEEELKDIICNYLKQKEIHVYETKYCKVNLRDNKNTENRQHHETKRENRNDIKIIKNDKPKQSKQSKQSKKSKNIILEIKYKNKK